jgi:hypothetical protein
MAGFPMSDIWIVFAIVGAVIALFIWDRLPVIVVCVGCAMALWATGVLTLNQSLAGFGDPATIFVASLAVFTRAGERVFRDTAESDGSSGAMPCRHGTNSRPKRSWSIR